METMISNDCYTVQTTVYVLSLTLKPTHHTKLSAFLY